MSPSGKESAKGRAGSESKVSLGDASVESTQATGWTPPNFDRTLVPVKRATSKEVLSNIGIRIRARRKALGMSILDVAEATGLSISMVSLAERAQTSPSIGTLVAICDTLSMSISDLFSPSPEATNPVVRRGDQLVQPESNGMTRRLVIKDEMRGLEVSEHEYVGRGATSGAVLTHHSGFEIGVVISGSLRVELEDQSFVLRAGDCIRFASTKPHRFTNEVSGRTKAMWLNAKSDLDHLGGLGIEQTYGNDVNGGS